MIICEDNREEFERELLAILILNEQAINYLQVKPMYFKNEELSKLFQYMLECYKEHKCFSISHIFQKHKEVNADLWVQLISETLYFKDAWQSQMAMCQESILTYYKEDVIKNLNKELADKKITYSQFTEKIMKIKEIKVNSKNEKSIISINEIDMSKEEEKEKVKSNCNLLDNRIKGFTLGQLSVWSGGNASAKSTYLNQVAIESIEQGYKVAIYSGELMPKRLLNWIILQCAGKRNMKHNAEKDYWYVDTDKKTKIMNWLNNKLFIYNNEYDSHAQTIIDSIKDCVLKQNIKVVILDNLMSMNLSGYGDNKYDVQSDFVKDLSALAKSLDIHIHFVCHPRKVTNFLRKIDISGSADLTNVADNVFIMHRVNNDFKIKTKEMFKWNDSSEIYNYTNIIEVCKNRDYGVEDYFVGLYFENESKRLKNEENEFKKYSWEWSG